MKREQITELSIALAVEAVQGGLATTIENKGDGTFSSSHEILGVLEEELYELKKAVHEKKGGDALKRELIDIAVGATFAIACIDQESTDW